MGEYKPRRLGDSFASTTPVRGNAPKPPEQSTVDPTYIRELSVGKVYADAVAPILFSTALIANFRVFMPISITNSYKLNKCQINVETADSGIASGAFYTYVNGQLTQIRTSEFSISTSSTGIRTASLPPFTLTPENQYFWGFVVTAAAAELAGLSLATGTSITRNVPIFYQAGSSLPTSVYLSNLTQDYPSSGDTWVALTAYYYDSSVVKYL